MGSTTTHLTAPPRSDFIVGPVFDGIFFLLSPVFALGAGCLNWALTPGFVDTAIVVLIHAHLVAVLVRSHGNPDIRTQFPFRFYAVPVLLFLGMWYSFYFLVCCSVLATWWDVHHSGQQTFGLGRIYDSKLGNDMSVGRGLDQMLNAVMYVGPILAGATLMAHVDDFYEFNDVDNAHTVYFTAIPAAVEGVAGTITVAVITCSLAFCCYYVYRYRELAAQGYRIAPNKVLLYVTTGAVSILAWGFNSFGEAFFIMNLFHAVQYFALMWVMESKRMTASLRMSNVPGGRAIVSVAVAGACIAYGFFVHHTNSTTAIAGIMVCSLMHFWYDGFIWSVRKREA